MRMQSDAESDSSLQSEPAVMGMMSSNACLPPL